jgi:hypothetical protein
MTTPPTTVGGKPPKKARKKVTTDLGRQLLTRERQRLSREQAALAEQQLLEAERARTQQKRNVKSAKPLDIAVSRSIVKRFAGVLASEGVSVRISATPSTTTSAWTDFEQIVINYVQQDDDRVLAATMRGLAYHEGGHCRFTLPFIQLAEAAGQPADTKLHRAWNCLEDQRMETAVVSDSPRKAAYLTPMIMLDFVPTVNHAAANWPLLVWRRYLPTHIRKGARKLFVHQHNLMGLDGEALAKSIEAVTTKYVLADNAVTMWEAVVEYAALLQQTAPFAANVDDNAMGHQRQYKRSERNLDDFLVIPVEGGMVDEGADEAADEADESDTIDTVEGFQHFLDILFALLNGQDILPPVIYASKGEGEQGEGAGSPSDEAQPHGDAADEGDDEGDESDDDAEAEGDESEGGKGKGKASDDDTEGADDDEAEAGSNGSNDDDDDDDEADATATGGDDDGLDFANEPADDEQDEQGGASGEHKNTGVRDDLDYKNDDDLTDEALQEAIDEAAAARDSDPTLDGDVQSLHDAINNRTSDLLPYNAGVSQDIAAEATGRNLADDIEQAFRENTIDKAPGWVEGQRRGIVNVLRYETRRPGDVEFFRQYTETDAPGQNIAVSVLLDYSGSMGGATLELAQAGYATKLACQALDIPCTVTLWDTQATVLYDATEEADRLPVIVSAGGTDITVAVADLDKQRYEKDIHIVIIMTDGAWSGACGQNGFLASYKGDEGRYFIGLGYNSGWGDSGPGMAENLRRYGCDEAHGIASLMEIPRYLEQALVAFS